MIASVVIAEPLKSLIDTAWRQHSRTVKMTSDRFKLVFNTEGEEGDKNKIPVAVQFVLKFRSTLVLTQLGTSTKNYLYYSVSIPTV